MTRLRRLRLLFALLSGLALAFAFAPYEAPLVGWASLAALILVSLDARGWVALLAGYLHGAVFYVLSVPWIYTVMREHGGLAALPAAGVLALMVLVLATFPALFCLGIAWLSRRSILLALLAAPFLWVALEFARTHMPHIGFPWQLLGYSATRHLGLAQAAAVAGIWGVSFLVAAYNAVLAWFLLSRTRRAWLVWLIVTGAVVPAAIVGYRFVPTVIPQRVAHLVQPDLPQHPAGPGPAVERHAEDLDDLVEMSVAAASRTPGPIVWPEVPIALFVEDRRFAERAAAITRSTGQPFLAGVIGWDRDPGAPREDWRGPYNSAALFAPDGRPVFRYDKIRLVPYGEYVPWRRWLWFAEAMVEQVGRFEAGNEYAVGEFAGGRFGVFICYEAIFPDLVRQFTARGAGVLVNISNDGWFGRSAAPEQHLAIARVRAVENRRWLLRATNNGYTVAVDPYGRIAARLAPDTRGVLRAPYDYRSDVTLYVRFGDWLPWLCVIASVAAFLLARLRSAQKPKAG
jgi:apolipoprotein N-acyltransferase